MNGICVDGNAGTPHYYISVTHQPDGTLVGEVPFECQNGSTSADFSFAGKGQNGAATVHPDNGKGPISVTCGPENPRIRT